MILTYLEKASYHTPTPDQTFRLVGVRFFPGGEWLRSSCGDPIFQGRRLDPASVYLAHGLELNGISKNREEATWQQKIILNGPSP
ncbi:MAG: hypothetical protein M1438_16100, partial [Deltaproteobacteria bacterium]|nr:hypothetical protein [Deltaproteobacteria bacterium]